MKSGFPFRWQVFFFLYFVSTSSNNSLHIIQSEVAIIKEPVPKLLLIVDIGPAVVFGENSG